MKCQILFSRKNKKKYFKMSSAEIFTQHAKCYILYLLSLRTIGTSSSIFDDKSWIIFSRSQ